MLKAFGIFTLISTMTILAAVVLGGWVAGGEPETTKDIGARVPGDVDLSPDSFVPKLSREEGLYIAREDAAKGFNIPRSEIDDLPVETTIAAFTGKPDVPGPDLSDHKVRVVVFKEFDYVSAFVPYGFNARYGDPRFTLVLDDATGEVIYGSVTHRKLKSGDGSP
jgi:hypothetical protein